ncbi:MAG: DoxX family protein [Fidelibacterota bacterium]|nr:MAG: DoxX family protein [Candidatus Neomarinimicrobiota bacterium]
MSTKRALILLLFLRLALGLFWIDHGLDKATGGWLTENKLKTHLTKTSLTATGAPKVYLKHFAIPVSGVLRYLVTLGELAVGLALLAGFWMKPASWGAVFMVLNFKFAGGSFQNLDFIGDAYLFPLLVATLAAAYIEAPKEWSIRRFIPTLDRYEV